MSAPAVLTYPTNAELRLIERDLLPVLTMNDPIFKHFPIVDTENDLLMWEFYNNLTGLQGPRGINGDPGRVKQVGAKRFIAEPGYYGEFAEIDEMEITRRRPLGAWTGVTDITDLVRLRQDQLLNREINRIRTIIWNLVSTGTFSVLAADGTIMHTDSFALQTMPAAVDWRTSGTATPLVDFRNAWKLHRGHSIDFGRQAEAMMNMNTFDYLVSNTNQDDLAGRRVTGLLSPLNLGEINSILLGENLPTVVQFDDGYYDDNGNFQLYIPDGVVIIIGRRENGSTLGEYRKTRNANNPNFAPGSYVQVVDSINGDKPIPRKVWVHRGHNGGPVLYYPNGVIVMSVY